jgi:ADP-ribose pyrophosphatase
VVLEADNERPSADVSRANSHIRDVVEHSGAVVIVPILPDGRLVLVYQYRHAVSQSILEFPAGTLEENEEAIDCAQREIVEEVGYAAAQWTSLGTLLPAPGFCDEVLHVFLANKLSTQVVSADDDEIIEVRLMSVDEVLRGIVEGDIVDAKTIAAFCRAKLGGFLDHRAT